MTLPPDLPEADGPRDHLEPAARPEPLTGPDRHPHAGDCEGTLCDDCGCCWHSLTCAADCCHNRDCGCSL